MSMRSAARLRTMRLQWQSLVTPLTPKAVIAEWSRREGDIAAKLREASSTKKEVEPIDWAYWKTQISAPGVVDEMQKEYESLKFPDVEPDVSQLSAIQAELADATAQAKLGESELKEVDRVLGQVAKLKAEGMTWDLEQWYKFMPGLEEQHKAEYEDEDYLVGDEHLKLDSVDWAAAGKDISAGGDPEIGVADAVVGDMNTAEEKRLIEEGKWSIGRLFASKDERAKIQERVEKALSQA